MSAMSAAFSHCRRIGAGLHRCSLVVLLLAPLAAAQQALLDQLLSAQDYDPTVRPSLFGLNGQCANHPSPEKVAAQIYVQRLWGVDTMTKSCIMAAT